MLTFWANICETDVESYACTLMLPEYMAHLQLSTFHFSHQPHNLDGRRPLVLTFFSTGRVEDTTLKPEEHALPLLQYVCPSISASVVRIPAAEDSVWLWNSVAQNSDFVLTERQSMRLFFEMSDPPDFLPAPHPFPAKDAFVSVSRKTAFLGRGILRSYFEKWISRLGASVTSDNGVKFSPCAGGFTFEINDIGGDFLIENDSIFNDLLVYSHLKKLFDDAASQYSLNIDRQKVAVSNEGLTIPLTDR